MLRPAFRHALPSPPRHAGWHRHVPYLVPLGEREARLRPRPLDLPPDGDAPFAKPVSSAENPTTGGTVLPFDRPTSHHLALRAAPAAPGRLGQHAYRTPRTAAVGRWRVFLSPEESR